MDAPNRRYRLIECEGKWFVIPADEVKVFCHWCLAEEGKRHFPRDFKPAQVAGPEGITFENWEEGQ